MNIVICDDDYTQLTLIKSCIDYLFKEHNEVYIFQDESALIEFILSNSVDIVILDIKLKKGNGIEVAKEINKKLPKVSIIFMSGYAEYHEYVYEAEHIYFITKPIKMNILKNAVIKAAKKKQFDNMTIEFRNTFVTIDLSKVLYFESKGRNINIYMDEGETKILKYFKLSDIENMLTERQKDIFIRCHQSFIVNITKMVKFKSRCIYLNNNESINVSRRYLKNVNNKISMILWREI